MDPVRPVGELDGLAEMMAALIRGNVEAHPELGEVLKGARGAVAITARDVPATVGMSFRDGTVEISATSPKKPSVVIIADSDGLMSFSTVPLRFGLPDVMTQEGRMLTRRILKRDIIVRGMITHLGLVRRLQKLLTVS
ncbi:MAG: hypothetical protein LC750_12355 [Actinobacteria bacterium]|nr:hypothetical protein [Actinomycetota bacterium]